ncbi:MAG: type II secretion system protein GspK, partial [bacterium]|nr:type II secretion system protein GspK [bacterium]
MKNQDGVVLIITLWILLILSTIALGFAFELHLESRLARYQLDSHTAAYLAQAGINRAMVELKNDLLLDRKARPQIIDSLGENWANNENTDEYYTDIELGEGKYSVTVTDEYSKININYMTREMLITLLTVMHPELADNEDLTNLMADALTDYRDLDTQYWKDTTLEEGTYYNPESANTEAPPFQFKNAPFETVDELLNLPGFTPALLYGKVVPAFAGMTSPLRKQGLNELLTVHGSGVINLNTAPYPVLITWFRSGVPDLETAQDLAQQVIEHRDGIDEEPGTDDDKPFLNIAELGGLS